MLNTDVILITSPLVTKLIIEQILLANAKHAAESAGLPTAGLKDAKPVGYGLGLAVGLFAMLYTNSLLDAHESQIATSLGVTVRSAVSLTVHDCS